MARENLLGDAPEYTVPVAELPDIKARPRRSSAAHFERAYRRNLRLSRVAPDERGTRHSFTPSSLAMRVAQELNRRIAMGQEKEVFVFAMALALFKDFLDVGLMTAAGYITVFISGVLMYFLWGKGWFLRQRARIIWWCFGFLFDSLPLIGLVPINFIMVWLAWRNIQRDAEGAQVNLTNLNEKSEKELEEFAASEELEVA